jgi:hypothetical protein
MSKNIAYCGLDCSVCPAYVATVNNDDALKAKIAEQWSKDFGGNYKPEDIECDGCISEAGRHSGYCSVCEIRLCGVKNEVENCAHCKDYSCEKLSAFHAGVTEAKNTLDGIRKCM